MAEPVTHLPRAVPDEVTITQDDMRTPRFTPRELRTIKEQTGKTLTEILTDEHSDDRFLVYAWTKLHRDGHEITWDDLDDIVITVKVEQPDPTSGPASTTSPPSAATGA